MRTSLGSDDVDETGIDVDIRPAYFSVSMSSQAQEGCRGIADGDDDRPFEGCGFIHGSFLAHAPSSLAL